MAYVTLEDEASLNEALKEVERVHMDRKIRIIEAKPKSEIVHKEKKPKTTKNESKNESKKD